MQQRKQKGSPDFRGKQCVHFHEEKTDTRQEREKKCSVLWSDGGLNKKQIENFVGEVFSADFNPPQA